MGNCFGKESSSSKPGGGDNFRGTGQTIADFNARQTNAPAASTGPSSGTTAKIPSSIGGPPRTLGTTAPASGGEDPRSAAARAAEARAAKPVGKDKLSTTLAAQKKAGMQGALQEAAEDNRRARETDNATEVRNYN